MEENKLFDKWNDKKKIINKQESRLFYREKEVWWCNLGKNIGFEEDGKGDNYERPVLIIKAFSRFACLIIPMTKVLKDNPFYLKVGNIYNKEACIIISQIRLIDTKRLINRIAIIDDLIFEEIRKAVRDLF